MNNCTSMFEDVWYASETHASKVDKVRVYEHNGSLSISDSNKIAFFNPDGVSVRIDEIESISLGRQKLNWMTYAKLNGFFLLLCVITKGSLLYYLVCLGVGNILGVLFGWWLVPWVVVEFRHDGVLRKAYFMDGSYRGYGGAFGGTKRLYKRLTSLAPAKR